MQVLAIPLLAAYPFMSKLSGLQLTLIVNCASLLKNILSVSIVQADQWKNILILIYTWKEFWKPLVFFLHRFVLSE